MDFCCSTVAVLYEKAAASVRRTFGCFDPRPWFGSKGRVAALIASVVNKARTV